MTLQVDSLFERVQAFVAVGLDVVVLRTECLVGSKDGTVIKVEGGELVAKLPGRITQFSPNNLFVVTSSSVCKLADGLEIIKFPLAAQFTFSRTKPDIAFALHQGVLHRLDLVQAQSTQLGMIGPAENLTLIPGDETVVLGTLPDTIAAWATSRPSSTSSLKLGQIAAISGNCRYAVSRGKTVNAYEVWDLFERKKLANFGEENSSPAQFKMYTFGISDNAVVAYSSDLREVTLFDSRNNKVQETWKPKIKTPTGAFKTASITPDGETVLLGEAGFLHGRDKRTGNVWMISPDSRNVTIASSLSGPTSQVCVFSIADDEQKARFWPVLELELEAFSANRCAFTPDSRTLIVIDQAGLVNYIHANSASLPQ